MCVRVCICMHFVDGFMRRAFNVVIVTYFLRMLHLTFRYHLTQAVRGKVSVTNNWCVPKCAVFQHVVQVDTPSQFDHNKVAPAAAANTVM